MTDHEKTIREALLEYAEYRGEHNTAAVITNALSALTALQEERERMRALIRRAVEDHFSVNWQKWPNLDAETRDAVSELSGLSVEFIDAAIGEPTDEEEGGKPLTVQPSGQGEVMPGLGPLPASDTGAAYMPRCGGKCGDAECEEAAARYGAEGSDE